MMPAGKPVDKEVRIDCERRLTSLESSTVHHHEEVIDLKRIIAKMDAALEKFAGNGWSKKIEKLGERFEEICRLMTERLAIVEGQNIAAHRRVDALETSADSAIRRFEHGLEKETERRREEDGDLRAKWRWLVALQISQLLTLIGALLGIVYWISTSLHNIIGQLP